MFWERNKQNTLADPIRNIPSAMPLRGYWEGLTLRTRAWKQSLPVDMSEVPLCEALCPLCRFRVAKTLNTPKRFKFSAEQASWAWTLQCGVGACRSVSVREAPWAPHPPHSLWGLAGCGDGGAGPVAPAVPTVGMPSLSVRPSPGPFHGCPAVKLWSIF